MLQNESNDIAITESQYLTATNPNGNATLADGSITSSYADIASAHHCTQLPFTGIGSAYRKVISAHDKLVPAHWETLSRYADKVSAYRKVMSAYGEIVPKDGSITSVRERMASPNG